MKKTALCPFTKFQAAGITAQKNTILADDHRPDFSRIPCAVKRRFLESSLQVFSLQAAFLCKRRVASSTSAPADIPSIPTHFFVQPPRKVPRLPASRLCPASDIDGILQAFRPENLSHRGIIENIVYGRTSAAAGFRKAGCGRCPALCQCQI